MVDNEGILISMLFNLKIEGVIKQCKNCDSYFLVKHNRQVHCSDECRRQYKDRRHNQNNFKKRQIQRTQFMEYYDNNGNWTVIRSDQLALGSMRTGLGKNRNPNFDKEKTLVENQLKALRLRRYST